MGGKDEEIFLKKINDLIDNGFVNVILDLLEVDWMNSRGLGMCISAMTSLRNWGGDLKLANVVGQTRELIEKMAKGIDFMSIKLHHLPQFL